MSDVLSSPRSRISKKRRGKTAANPFVTLVTLLGFKPKTFSSVVRCSIQLSYRAIP